MPLLTSRSAQLVLKRAPGDPKQASGFPGSPPTTRKPGIPPLPLDVLREGVGPSALHPIPPRRKHTHPGLSHGPDSQTLQPKFNFQLLLTLDRERSKLERVKGGGGRGEGRRKLWGWRADSNPDASWGWDLWWTAIVHHQAAPSTLPATPQESCPALRCQERGLGMGLLLRGL